MTYSSGYPETLNAGDSSSKIALTYGDLLINFIKGYLYKKKGEQLFPIAVFFFFFESLIYLTPNGNEE